MLYDFLCTTCQHEQVESFPASDYDNLVEEDGRLKDKKCENCETINLYRCIKTAPAALGGSKNYMSMERWWAQNKGLAKQKEDELAKKLADRHTERVISKIDKQNKGQGSDKRHKGYGSGQGEQKLKSD